MDEFEKGYQRIVDLERNFLEPQFQNRHTCHLFGLLSNINRSVHSNIHGKY